MAPCTATALKTPSWKGVGAEAAEVSREEGYMNVLHTHCSMTLPPSAGVVIDMWG